MQTYTHETGQVYMMGCEKPKHVCEAYRDAAAVHDLPTILQAIKDGRNSLYKWCYTILNQTQHPWCWAFSGTQTLMVLLNQLFGDKTILDPSMGPAITGVRGGNSIDAMLLEVQSVCGQFPAAFNGVDPVKGTTNISQNSWPANWKTEAAKRESVVDSVLRCHSELALASALIDMGPDDPCRPCDVGISWQGGGHALTCLEVGTDDGQTLFFAGPNSWGLSFDSGWGSYPGRPGWWKLPSRLMGEAFSADGFGSYCLVAAKDAVAPVPPSPPDPPAPPGPVPPTPQPTTDSVSRAAAVSAIQALPGGDGMNEQLARPLPDIADSASQAKDAWIALATKIGNAVESINPGNANQLVGNLTVITGFIAGLIQSVTPKKSAEFAEKAREIFDVTKD